MRAPQPPFTEFPDGISPETRKQALKAFDLEKQKWVYQQLAYKGLLEDFKAQNNKLVVIKKHILDLVSSKLTYFISEADTVKKILEILEARCNLTDIARTTNA